MQFSQKVWKKKEKPESKKRITIPGPQNFEPDTFFTESYIAQNPRKPVGVFAAYSTEDEVTHEEGFTVYSYTYVTVDGFRICLVDHAHLNAWSPDEIATNPWIAGNSFIPGYVGHWWKTPSTIVNWLQTEYHQALTDVLTKNPVLTDRKQFVLYGAFPPGDERYPKKL